MAGPRVISLDESSILALFDAKRSEDLAVFGTRADMEDAEANIASQGILIANNHTDILAAQTSITSHGSTLTSYGSRITTVEGVSSANGNAVAALKPRRIVADSGANVPANTVVSVGNLALTRGGECFDVSSNSLVAKMPGLFLWTALYYMPAGGAERQGFANPPDENGHFDQTNISSTTGTDRESLSGCAFFSAVGKTISFEWRSTQLVNSCTFGLRGAFFPLFVNT